MGIVHSRNESELPVIIERQVSAGHMHCNTSCRIWGTATGIEVSSAARIVHVSHASKDNLYPPESKNGRRGCTNTSPSRHRADTDVLVKKQNEKELKLYAAVFHMWCITDPPHESCWQFKACCSNI